MEQQKFVRKNTVLFDAERRNEKKRSRRTAFYVFLFLTVSLIFLVVSIFVFLNVKTIKINGNEKYTNEEIGALIPIVIGDNMFSFDSEEIEAEIQRVLPYVGKVEIKRDLPTTVEVNIVEEIPYFATELAGDTYLVSSNLKVLERLDKVEAEDSGLTALTLNNVRTCIVGQSLEFVNKRTFDAILSLYQNFESNFIEDKIVSINVKSRFDIYVNYDDRFEVYFGDTEDIDIKVRFLIAIIDELDPNSTGVINVSDPREAAVALS